MFAILNNTEDADLRDESPCFGLHGRTETCNAWHGRQNANVSINREELQQSFMNEICDELSDAQRAAASRSKSIGPTEAGDIGADHA